MRKTILIAALLSAAATIAVAQQAAPQGADAPGAAPASGRGAGRGPQTPNPDIRLQPFAPSTAQVTYSASCAGCHGTILANGPKARSLFTAAYLASRNDDEIAATIQKGWPAAGMPSFAGTINDALAHQISYYLRITAGRLNAQRITMPDPNGMVVKSAEQTFKLEVLAAGLDVPWGMAFLPGGKKALVTERAGRLRILDLTTNTLSAPIAGTPATFVRQDGGYLDVAIHPNYAKNGWIYFAYVDVRPGVTPAPGSNRAPVPAPPTMTVIVRGRIKDGQWVDNQELFRAAPEVYTTNSDHYGLRFLFDKQNNFYWTLGDRHYFYDAQDLSKVTGKVHRVTDDGKPAPGNPFIDKPGADPTVWSYGHRNPEGLAWNPVDGHLWETEHGPTGGDEVNVIQKGHNYGWGVISRGIEPGIMEVAHEGMEQPKTFFNPSIGPGGITFYSGSRYPKWKNNLFITGMVGQKLIRMVVKKDEIQQQETLLDQIGRVRDVIQGPDGYLYILLQNPTGTPASTGIAAGDAGMVVRLVPVKD
jgi:aldose sugar dehydrogenase